MKVRTHKSISAFLNLLVVVGGFEVLIKILNLNEPTIYFKTAFYVGLFHILQIFLLYDLHYKLPGSFARAKKQHESVSHWFIKLYRVISSALWGRIAHLRNHKFLKEWLSYLILPGVIFWATISIFFVNQGYVKIQQIFVFLSSLALALNYWYLKEIFSRGKERVDEDIFVILSMVKIYASAIVYGASLALVRRYCLDAYFLTTGVFAITFLLVYQALFQHKLINIKNLTVTAVIAFTLSIFSYWLLLFWGYNYFTGGLILAVGYNLLWGVFHYTLDRALTFKAFLEILIISLVIAGMLFSVTNFKAKILDGCQYGLKFNDPRLK